MIDLPKPFLLLFILPFLFIFPEEQKIDSSNKKDQIQKEIDELTEKKDKLKKELIEIEEEEKNTKSNASEKKDSKFKEEDFFKLEDNIVVTASRKSQKVSDAPAAVYVITQKTIRERGYRTLVDALHDVPGFDFQHTYGVYPELIHQRGLVGENNRTLVYVDGVPDNNINENAILAGTIRFPLSNVDRIEIVSGPASALYGANAFNGIVNIITKDGKGNPGNHVDFTYGAWEKNFTNPGYSASFSARGSTGSESSDMRYSIGGYYYKTDGPDLSKANRLDRNGIQNRLGQNDINYYAETKACGGVCNPNSSSVGNWWSDGYSNSKEDTYNLTAKFMKNGLRFQTVNWQYQQGQGAFANGTQQIDTNQRGLDTGKLDGRNIARLLGILRDPQNIGTSGFLGSHRDFKNNSATIGYLHKFSDKLNLDSELVTRSTQVLSSSNEFYPNKTDIYAYYRPNDVVQASGNAIRGASAYSRPDNNYQLEEKLQYNQSEKMTTTVGVVIRQFITPKDYNSYERFVYNTYSGYIQQTYKPQDKVAITAGVRHDFSTTYGNTTNPRLSLIYKPTNDLTLKFLFGSGFREPSAKELFTQTAQRKPNPALRPELMQAHEIGVGYRFLKKYYISTQGYYNQVTNLILEFSTNDTTPINGVNPKNPWQQYQNLGIARIYGFELESNLQISDQFQASFNYTFTKGEYDRLPPTLQTSPATTGRVGDDPRNDLEMAIYRQITVSPQSPNGFNTIPISGGIPNIAPHKVNAGLTYSPVEDFSIYLGINYVDIRRTVSTDPVRTASGYKMVKLNLRKENLFYR
ncbi:MAG TPA: TonB-dependent receptor, partial [Leptospiraceae bacterium]|nr:TonB-dependent receptor [Leptospiraceae bacterium]